MFSVRESSFLLQQAIHSGTGSWRRIESNFTTALSQPLQRITTLRSKGEFRFHVRIYRKCQRAVVITIECAQASYIVGENKILDQFSLGT
jgi:hypothetical protein